MRIIKKTFQKTVENYTAVSKYETENNLSKEIELRLSAIFLISQNIPVNEFSDFFKNENFSITESFEELEISYLLIKYGLYKQAMTSLRVGFESGFISIYWSIIGKENEKYKKWFSSKIDTPRNKDIYQVLLSNSNIKEFDRQFNLIKEIKDLGLLSDFVHTKGLWHSNSGEIQQAIFKGKDIYSNFKEWYNNFNKIVEIIVILHLLKFPTMNLRYSTDFLLTKFGTYNRIPFFGGGHGDEMRIIKEVLSKEKESLINSLAELDEEVNHVKEWLGNLPDLTEQEIQKLIIDEQKNEIKNIGFNNWVKNYEMYDLRISEEMIHELKNWAQINNFMESKNPHVNKLFNSNNT